MLGTQIGEILKIIIISLICVSKNILDFNNYNNDTNCNF
jgi:hypothetical protein